MPCFACSELAGGPKKGARCGAEVSTCGPSAQGTARTTRQLAEWRTARGADRPRGAKRTAHTFEERNSRTDCKANAAC
eukprot:7066636-Alexandrium_andersonii.AAC.1